MNKILLTFGTRPELLKLISIIRLFEKNNRRSELYVLNTGQHDTLIDKEIEHFQIKVDNTFVLEKRDGNLDNLIGQLSIQFGKLKIHLISQKINLIGCIVQGDTASTFATSLFCFHNRIQLFHVEAGLRTNDIDSPHPEEFYRKTISQIASFHFVPGEIQKANLLNEKIKEERIKIVGNTIIDLISLEQKTTPPNPTGVLITLHRSHTCPKYQDVYIEYIRKLISQNPNYHFTFLGHPNHNQKFEGLEFTNLSRITAVGYAEMLNYYAQSCIVFTDSGGVQEEASFLEIPCIILREKTERIEGIQKGCAKIVNLNEHSISTVIDQFDFETMSSSKFIYGKGESAELIFKNLKEFNLS